MYRFVCFLPLGHHACGVIKIERLQEKDLTTTRKLEVTK